jgi:nicotinamide-nucleotide amidase
VLEELITDIIQIFPENLTISYLPGKAQVRLRLTGRGISDSVIQHHVDQITARLGNAVFGYGQDTLEAAVGRMLLNNQWTVGCAESCTGGAVSAKITLVPGASSYFKGSIISYSNEIKKHILGVSPHTLETDGAVSKSCVEQMVSGALSILNVDVAVAISGIAGPGGGSDEKPVGTVFIGVGDKNIIKVKQLTASKSRDVNIEYFTSYALNLMRLFLTEKIENENLQSDQTME